MEGKKIIAVNHSRGTHRPCRWGGVFGPLGGRRLLWVEFAMGCGVKGKVGEQRLGSVDLAWQVVGGGTHEFMMK